MRLRESVAVSQSSFETMNNPICCCEEAGVYCRTVITAKHFRTHFCVLTKNWQPVYNQRTSQRI
jgi:hypothetical protein